MNRFLSAMLGRAQVAPASPKPEQSAHCVRGSHVRGGAWSGFGETGPTRKAGKDGFTLAEVLAAMVFMAVVIPVVVEAMAVASRSGVLAQRKREAMQLADRMLTQMVVTGDWQNGNQSGDFLPDTAGYQWKLTVDGWPEDAMEILTVEVTFSVRGIESSVRLSTLVPETAS